MIDLGIFQLDDLQTPKHIQGVFDVHDWALGQVSTILENGQKPFSDKVSSRLFLNGGTRDDLSKIIFRTPKTQDEDLPSWMKRICNSDEFCLAVNGINGLSSDLHEYFFKTFNSPWLAQLGLPMGGIDSYCFVGQYPMTPFGIHTDREHTFLFHAGPGKKDAWLWWPEEFESKRGVTTQQFIFEDLEHLAQKITLEPGDVLFIPAGHYHVLANPEFSATIGIAPYDKNIGALIEGGLSEAVPFSVFDDGFNLEDPYSANINAALEFPVSAEAFDCRSLIEKALRSIEHEKLRLLSNGGMKFGPRRRHIKLSRESQFFYLGTEIYVKVGAKLCQYGGVKAGHLRW